MRRLLFLNGIKAFEAAARSGSFAAAGAELNVSPAAVSRLVHLLEQRLGVALFERKANRLAMTAAGRAYQSGLTPIFDAMADPAIGGFSKTRTRHRCPHHHRRCGGAVRRGLELRHQARRRRLAGAGRRTLVRRRPVAGMRAAAGDAIETS